MLRTPTAPAPIQSLAPTGLRPTPAMGRPPRIGEVLTADRLPDPESPRTDSRPRAADDSSFPGHMTVFSPTENFRGAPPSQDAFPSAFSFMAGLPDAGPEAADSLFVEATRTHDLHPRPRRVIGSVGVSLAVHVLVLLMLAFILHVEQITSQPIRIVLSTAPDLDDMHDDPVLELPFDHVVDALAPPAQGNQEAAVLPVIAEMNPPPVMDVPVITDLDVSSPLEVAPHMPAIPEADLGDALAATIPAAQRGEGGGAGGNGHNGGFGGEIGRRLAKAEAGTGAVQISLLWDNFNDLDLHVVTPRDEWIFFAHRRSVCGGQLDVDRNAGGPATRTPVENVFWSPQNRISGDFAIYVHHFSQYDAANNTSFEVHTLVDGKKQRFTGNVQHGTPPVLVARFRRTRDEKPAQPAEAAGFEE